MRAMVRLVLEHRPELYHNVELHDVAINRGSRINDKAQQLLRKMVYASGVTSRDLVAEAVSKGRRGPEIGRVGTVRKVRRRKAVDRSYVQRERHDREDSDSVVLLDW